MNRVMVSSLFLLFLVLCCLALTGFNQSAGMTLELFPLSSNFKLLSEVVFLSVFPTGFPLADIQIVQLKLFCRSHVRQMIISKLKLL